MNMSTYFSKYSLESILTLYDLKIGALEKSL